MLLNHRKNRPLIIIETSIPEVLNHSCGQINISNCKQSEAKTYQSPLRRISQFPKFCFAENCQKSCRKWFDSRNRNLQTENVSAIHNSTMPPTVINITWSDAGERSENRPLNIHLSLQLWWPFVFVYKHQSHPSPQQQLLHMYYVSITKPTWSIINVLYI